MLLPVAECDGDFVVGKVAGEIDAEGDGGEFFEELGDDFGGVEDGGAGEAEVGEEHVVDGGSRFAGGEAREGAGDDDFDFDIFDGEALEVFDPFLFDEEGDDGGAWGDDGVAEGLGEGVAVAGGAHALVGHAADGEEEGVGGVGIVAGGEAEGLRTEC